MKTKYGYKVRSKKALIRFLMGDKLGVVFETKREKTKYSQFERNFHLVGRLIKVKN